MEGKHFLKVGISVSLGVLISISAFAGGTKWPKGWVRVGELGQRPKRISDEFPLSDQGNKGHWKEYEVMSDEFYGSELDSNKWHPTNPRWLGRQPAYFYPGNVKVTGGKLHLTMRKQEVPEMPRDKGYHTYTSAAVQSKTKVKYGYFEVKCKPMKSHGSSSFWFYDNTPKLWTEIDVFEIGGGAPKFEKKYNMNVHVFRTPTEKKHWSMAGVWTAPSNLADDYHVYGLEWDKEKIKWYFDGVLVRWVENTHWHQPLTLNFDSETMPKWFGLPKDSDLPSTYSIEYVRAWKKETTPNSCAGATYEIYPATVDSQEEFERLANSLKPGDELVLHRGVYSQNGRRAVTAKGTHTRPILIRAAEGEKPLLTRPADNIDKHNNIEFVDCSYLIVRGLRFQGGSSGVRFIRGHHITFEECEIFETGNNALTMNSGNCDSFVIRRNHIHHTGLSQSGHTEGEGMYIGVHNGSRITTNTLVEVNYIHHLRSTSNGGNDGIEIKFGSYGNTVRDNVIHDTNIGRQYPGIFVYGGGPRVNIVEGNVIWKAGEGIQVVSDAVVRNNIIFDCSATGITAAPHAAVPQIRNVKIVNNTIVNHPRGVLIRWSLVGAVREPPVLVFANNAIYCPGSTAIDASGIGSAVLSSNYIAGDLNGVAIDNSRFYDGGSISAAFVGPNKKNYWPKQGSVLINHANPTFAPKLDFHRTIRKPPFDVGAYESEGHIKNPGRPDFFSSLWSISSDSG
ncbi:MAG TPA: family 16 glycosylhydrolase [Planctomycetes bacterium]|nr:family 16 glycosylhydrolase [Planctomycetota bacterium]